MYTLSWRNSSLWEDADSFITYPAQEAEILCLFGFGLSSSRFFGDASLLGHHEQE